jgi:nicotinamidase-related amidase
MGTELDVVLRSNGMKTVIVTGVTTERCVLATVSGAIAHDYYVVVPRDCVASQKVDMHNAGLLAISGNLLKEGVTDSSKIIELWRSTLHQNIRRRL